MLMRVVVCCTSPPGSAASHLRGAGAFGWQAGWGGF